VVIKCSCSLSREYTEILGIFLVKKPGIALVWFVFCVDSDVSVQMTRLTKNLVTHVTFVWFVSTVNTAVSNKVI